jgi:hypothetical protein
VNIRILLQFLQKRRRLRARERLADLRLRHSPGDLGVRLVTFLKFTLDAGQ